MTAIVYNSNTVPRYQDAGVATVIESLSEQGGTLSEFLEAFNGAISLPALNEDMFLRLYSDLKARGVLPNTLITGDVLIPDPVERPEAPGGIASDGSFFSTPTSGTYRVRVYKNGGFVYESEPVDLSVNRSLNNAGFQSGDVMQVALVSGGVVGWWGRKIIE
jgi:hypothetical protein